ncbi:MAG: PH domain-containing protein [Anaerococcus sp.]
MYYRLIFIGMTLFINVISLFMDLKMYKLGETNILYTRIPYFLQDDRKLVSIVEEGKKSTKFFYLTITVFAMSSSTFLEPVSIMLLDIIFIILVRPFFLQKDIDKVRKFKNNRIDNEEKVKVIDLDLIEKKDSFQVRKIFYLPVVIIYMLAIILEIILDTTYPKFMWIFLGLVFCASDIFIDWLLMSRLVKAYTRDSETNILLNEKIGKNQSKILYRKSLINGILFLIFVLVTLRDPYSYIGFIIFIGFLTVNIGYAFLKYEKLSRDPLLKDLENNIVDDDIEYYNAWGYNNPDDKRFLVNSVYGIGSDLNIGRLSGKIYYLVTILILVFFLIFTTYVFSMPTNYFYKTEGENIKITSTMFYKDDIEASKIEKISLLDKLPEGKGIRVSGIAFENTSTGSYSIEGYGNVRLYIYNNSKKVIEIKTKDKKFLINEDTDQKTEELYKRLNDFINK